MRPKRSELEKRYGPITDFIWERQAEFMTRLVVPQELKPYWRYSGNAVSSIYLNKDMLEPLSLAFSYIIQRNCQSLITSFDGCFAIRRTRGAESLSAHAYGLALDINAKGNALGEVPTMDQKLVKCFLDADFVWGGNFKRLDGMHFQYLTEDRA